MATLEGRLSYSSRPKMEKENENIQFDDDYSDPVWDVRGSRNSQLGSEVSKQGHFDPFPYDTNEFMDDGYDSGDDTLNPMQNKRPPEVNLKNVLSGLFAIVTGMNKAPKFSVDQQHPSTNVSFLGSGNNGDTYLNSSVYIPSAPPLLEPSGTDYTAYKEILEAEPPEWLPDSSTKACMQCSALFTALTRGRHHCRFCGGIFCRTCSPGRCLLPTKFRERNPQRVCDACYDRLDPLQSFLINSISNAVQVAKHDVIDWTCTRGWLNLPIGISMEDEIYKASNTLRSYSQVNHISFLDLITPAICCCISYRQ